MEEPTKICKKCNTEKLINYFYKQIRNRDGYFHYCKSCANSQSISWRENNPQRTKEINRLSKKNTINRCREYEKEKRRTDINFKLRKNLRGRLKKVLKKKMLRLN